MKAQVFPTPVGVFLTFAHEPGSAYRLPHARGGVSSAAVVAAYKAQSSPRPWGCFRENAKLFTLEVVFPTPVGVFPRQNQDALPDVSLPHARGGVSEHCYGSSWQL